MLPAQTLRTSPPGETHPPTCFATVVVPTYREAVNAREMLARIESVRTANHLDLELLFVDDESGDGIGKVLEGCGRPWVRLLTRRGERGLATAAILGIRAASHGTIIIMDGDLSHPCGSIPDLLRALDEGAEIAVGSRFVAGGSTDAEWTAARRVNSFCATLLARPFTRIADPMSGFIALRKSTFDRAAPLSPVGYKIGLEIIVRSRSGRVVEVPIRFCERRRGSSKLNVQVRWQYLRHLCRLALFRITGGLKGRSPGRGTIGGA